MRPSGLAANSAFEAPTSDLGRIGRVQAITSSLSRQYVKLCDVRDFEDPRLRSTLRDISPGHSEQEELHRKLWEYAMLAMYLEEVGALTDDAHALAVAAGHEAPLFWLANRIRRIVATDIYGEGSFQHREAVASMLTDPGSFAPYPYREKHLEVLAMDALELNFADASFDFVFSLSSIEHFGGPSEIIRAAREMGRVTRPGGHLVIVTECLVGRHPLNSPKLQLAIRLATLGRRCQTATAQRRIVDMFTPSEIIKWIVEPLRRQGLTLAQPLDLRQSPESRANTIKWIGAGELCPATGDPYPHIMLKAHGSPWTSIFLAFQRS